MFMNLGGSLEFIHLPCQGGTVVTGSRPAQISSPRLRAPLSLMEQLLFTPVWSLKMKPLYYLLSVSSPGCNRLFIYTFLSCGFKHSWGFSFYLLSLLYLSSTWLGWLHWCFFSNFFILKYAINFCKRSPDVFSGWLFRALVAPWCLLTWIFDLVETWNGVIIIHIFHFSKSYLTFHFTVSWDKRLSHI